MNQYLLKPKQVADSLKIPTGVLAKMRVTGKGPAYIKIGKSVFYDPKDLEAWISANRRVSTSSHANV